MEQVSSRAKLSRCCRAAAIAAGGPNEVFEFATRSLKGTGRYPAVQGHALTAINRRSGVSDHFKPAAAAHDGRCRRFHRASRVSFIWLLLFTAPFGLERNLHGKRPKGRNFRGLESEREVGGGAEARTAGCACTRRLSTDECGRTGQPDRTGRW